MKKNIFSGILAVVMILSLLLGMTACGEDPAETNGGAGTATSTDAGTEGHVHVWEDATCVAPKTCTECGETEGEALGHTPGEATYFAAAVCEVCGESVGEPKANFFDENNITVTKIPTTFSFPGLNWVEDHPDYQREITFNCTVKELKMEADAKEGYKKVTITFAGTAEQIWRDENGHEGYTNMGIRYGIFDLYTGQEFSEKDSSDGNEATTSYTLELDGVTYEITGESETSWSFTDWVPFDNDPTNASCKGTITNTYVFHVPENYNGLVLSFAPGYDIEHSSDWDGESVEFLDPTDIAEGTLFYLLSK